MKSLSRLLALAVSIVISTIAQGQSTLVYDNHISLSMIDNGRVNDPSFPVYLINADNFTLASNSVINQVSWFGGYKTSYQLPNGDDNFTILFFPFEGNIPSITPLASFPVGTAERHLTSQTIGSYGYYVFSYSAQFPDLSLPKGTYLLAIMNDPAETANWMWASDDGQTSDSYLELFEGTPWMYASGGGVAEFAFSLLYLDTTPPQIKSIDATPKMLWPPDHRMVPIRLTIDAVDNRDAMPTTRIVAVRSNEPQGRFEPDWEITGSLSLNLRAERSESKVGRIYTIVVESKDSSGNAAYASVNVTVPHDRR